MDKLMEFESRKVCSRSAVPEQKKNVLVGTYAGSQLTDWPGYYPYPITTDDKVDADACAKINEIWLFKGTKEPKYFAAEFVGIKTRQELKSLGYPARGREHGDGTYILFKIEKTYAPASSSAVIAAAVESVTVRVKDFARSPKVRKQLKDYLESSDRNDKDLTAKLPHIIVKVPARILCVCDPGVQLDMLGMMESGLVMQQNAGTRNVVSLFSGAGGLDLGFERAGFSIIWANEYDKDIWSTYEHNHRHTHLCRKSICDVDASEVPGCIGIIGGPPCQSWSEGGAKRGIKDKRGQLFFDYIRILKAKQPLFFLAENVSGMLLERHRDALNEIKRQFSEAGYELSFTPVNAWEYGVPQDRERVLFVGYRNDVGKKFVMPAPLPENERKSIRDAIGDLVGLKPGMRKNGLVPLTEQLPLANHEYMTGGFSSIFMSRNRVRSWDEPAFTVQAGGRQSQLHPSAPKMVKVADDQFVFAKGYEDRYRRLTVREAARIQTFPDDFVFQYDNIAHGYKMIGNAVPVELARVVANQIMADLKEYL